MKAARWLIGRFAPAEWRESLQGDLHEEAARRVGAGRYAGWMWSVPAAIVLARTLRGEAKRSHVAQGRPRLSEGVWQDIRLSVRSLRATPAFTVSAILVLALGIGASTAIYSVVDAVLLRSLPFEDSDRIMAVGENGTDRPTPILSWMVGSAAAPNYLDWVQMQTVFESLAASRLSREFTVRDSGEPEDLGAIRATANLLDVLRVRPIRGQAFTADNEVEGRDRVLLISHELWQRRFAAYPDIIGKTMTFDGGTWQIVGVLPEEFGYPIGALKPTDIVAPDVVPARERIRNMKVTGRSYNLRVVGRLKDGVSPEQARAEMARITSVLASKDPEWFKDHTWALASLHESTVGRSRNWMMMLLGAVGCVLLIACANVANLLLVRATGRAREVMVRSALGASRWRIARSLLIESLVLSVAGLAAALLVALWGVSVLRASMPGNLPRLASVGLDLRILFAATAATALTGLVCGLFPALQLSRPNMQAALREGDAPALPGGLDSA